MGEEYERILLVKPDVFIYKIPPRTTNRGYRASDWKLDEPDWTGRLRVVTKGKECTIKIEDKNSGLLFAQCPIEKYPGVSIEAVSDSSRYFVLKIVNDNGQSAFIGIGFSDRGDSFDVNVALQDHFKWLEKQEEIEKGDAQQEDSAPKLDLKFKEGQTIKVKINNLNSKKARPPKAKGSAGGFGILPPPPGGVGAMKFSGPPGASSAAAMSDGETAAAFTASSDMSKTQQPAASTSGGDLLADFDNLTMTDQAASTASKSLADDGNLFSSSTASSTTDATKTESGGSDWAQF